MIIGKPHNAPTLGLVASGKRPIRSGVEFNHLYPASHKLERTDPIIDNGDTYRTLEIMEDYARKYKGDTAKITEFLRKGRNINTQRNAILKDLWEHVYHHFQYKEDKPGIEQIRRPARSWHDRHTGKGIDCDCMSVLFSSMLLNIGIPHAFRKTKYHGDWQHVYVVVPKSNTKSLNNRQNYYVLDAVVDSYDHEVPFSEKHDRPMKIQGLNGLDTMPAGYDDFNIKENYALDLLGIPNSRAKEEFGKEFGFLNGLANVQSDQQNVDMFLKATKRHLENTYQIIKSNPKQFEGFTYGYPVQSYLLKLGYLLNNWNDEETRTTSLNELIIAEKEGLNGFFSNIGDAIKNVTQSVATGVKNAAQWTGNALKTAGQAIVKFNPVSLAARAGLLIAFKTNLFRMAGRLGYGYWTESQARSAGLDLSEYRKIKGKLERVKKMYKGLCGGRVSNGEMDKLKDVIQQGFEKDKRKNPGVLRGLGLLRIRDRESITDRFNPIVKQPVITIADDSRNEDSKITTSIRDRFGIQPIVKEPINTTDRYTTPTKTAVSPLPTKNNVLIQNASAQQLIEHLKRGGEFKYSFNKAIMSVGSFNELKKRFKRSPLVQAKAYVDYANRQNGTVQLLDSFSSLSRLQESELRKDYSVANPSPTPLPQEPIVKTPVKSNTAVNTPSNSILDNNATADNLLKHVQRGGKFKYSFNKLIMNAGSFNELKKRFKRSPLVQAKAHVDYAKRQKGTVQLLNQFDTLDRGVANEVMKDYSVKSTPTNANLAPPKPTPAQAQEMQNTDYISEMQTTEIMPQQTQAGGNTGLIIGGIVLASGIAYYAFKGDKSKAKSTQSLNGTSAKKKAKKTTRKPTKRKKTSSRNKKMTF